MRNGLQVSRVYAGADTTEVIKFGFVGYRSNKEFVSHSISFSGSLISSSAANSAIAVSRVNVCGPQPTAAIGFWADLVEKALQQCTLGTRHCDSPVIAVFRATQRVNAAVARFHFSARRAV